MCIAKIDGESNSYTFLAMSNDSKYLFCYDSPNLSLYIYDIQDIRTPILLSKTIAS